MLTTPSTASRTDQGLQQLLDVLAGDDDPAAVFGIHSTDHARNQWAFCGVPG